MYHDCGGAEFDDCGATHRGTGAKRATLIDGGHDHAMLGERPDLPLSDDNLSVRINRTREIDSIVRRAADRGEANVQHLDGSVLREVPENPIVQAVEGFRH